MSLNTFPPRTVATKTLSATLAASLSDDDSDNATMSDSRFNLLFDGGAKGRYRFLLRNGTADVAQREEAIKLVERFDYQLPKAARSCPGAANRRPPTLFLPVDKQRFRQKRRQQGLVPSQREMLSRR